MNNRPSAPAKSRDQFVDFLEQAKRSLTLKLMADRTTRDGPNKMLGKQGGNSPGRISEFLRPDYRLKVLEKEKPPKLFPQARIRKTVAGFANSVQRAVSWLEQESFAVHSVLNT